MKLKIKVGNVELEVDGSEAEVERERVAMTDFLSRLSEINSDIIMRGNDIQTEHNSVLLEDGAVNHPHQSFNEFLRDTTAKRDTDIVMAAAYFLYKCRGVECFTLKDLDELLTESHVKRPGNISQAITQNIKKGLISLVKGDGSGLKTYQVLTSADDWFAGIKTE